MTVVITGASGFVGGHVAARAIAAGHAVRCLVRATSDVSALEPLGVELMEGDVTDLGSVEAAFAGAGAVIHAAGVLRSYDEAGFARVNSFGARVVAEASCTCGVGRLVHVSSLAARGPSGRPAPVSDYGRSKLAGERAILAVADRVEVVVTRPTMVYGPGNRDLLPCFQMAREGLRPVLGAGGRLSAVHVGDLAAGLVGLIDPPLESGSVFEVSDGHDYSWDELVESIARSVDRPGRAVHLPVAAFRLAAGLSETVARLARTPMVFDRGKLREMLGSWPADPAAFWRTARVRPRFDFEGGAADTARAYRAVGWL